MSIFKKIKQGLGVGTAKLALEIPRSIPGDAGELSGKVIISAKSDQKVLSIKVRLVENIIVDRGDEEEEDILEMASVILDEPFEIKQDEQRAIEFKLPFQLAAAQESEGDKVGQVLNWLSSASSLGYEVLVKADLENVVLDPTASERIQFT